MSETNNISTDKAQAKSFWERHGAAVLTGLSLLFIGLAWLAGKNEIKGPEIAFFALAYISGGYQQAIDGVRTLMKERELDVDLLMIVAALGAASIGYWMDGAILILIFSLSGTLEGYTMEKTNKDIRALMKLRPEVAMLLKDGMETSVHITELKIGDVIVVRPGERIGADGKITDGNSSINESSITGEYMPNDKKIGDEVFSGTINGQGSLLVKVTKPAGETMISKIIHLVQEAQNEKPPGQQFVERFERIYAKIVIFIAVLLLVIPPLFLGEDWQQSIYRAMIFLVVASPCALVASIMPAVLSGISNAAREGVLFKGGAHLQNIGRVKVVAFDKTGTLTMGQPQVTDIIPFDGRTEDDLLELAATVELLSEHPIARSIVSKATEKGINPRRPAGLQAVHGAGVIATLDNQEITIGKREIVEMHQLSTEQASKVAALENEGKTVIYVSDGTGILGVISLQDRIRTWTPKIVDDLKRMGLKVAMLTGDTQTTARAIAKKAEIDLVYASLLPAQKVEVVKELEAKYGKVAMIGDGVNDAPALAAATVGIAIGTGGTDVAIESADAIFIRDNIEKTPFAIKLGRRTGRVIRQNVIFAIAVVVLLVTLNFMGGMIDLPNGVIGHEGSTVLVILSGLRLLK